MYRAPWGPAKITAIVAFVAYVLLLLGLVALLQSVAWIAQAQRDERETPAARMRGRIGMLLAPVGLVSLAIGVLLLLIPDFLG